jgi:hypothetical protein
MAAKGSGGAAMAGMGALGMPHGWSVTPAYANPERGANGPSGQPDLGMVHAPRGTIDPAHALNRRCHR